MVNYGFVLLPLYLYPLPGTWDPLFNAANANPDVTFQVVINPDTGPGSDATLGTKCPGDDCKRSRDIERNMLTSVDVNAVAQLNAIPNIKTLAYVHSANRWNCGSGSDICPCTADLSVLKGNITTYQNWPTAGCSINNAKDIHIDGLFIDEAPTIYSETDGSCTSWMQDVTSFAKSTLTHGNTIMLNPGGPVNSTYWSLADYINVFEDTQAAYYSADIGSYDGNGVYSQQTTMIIHTYTNDATAEQKDVDTILNLNHDAMAGLYISPEYTYSAFPSNWNDFVGYVATVAKANQVTRPSKRQVEFSA